MDPDPAADHTPQQAGWSAGLGLAEDAERIAAGIRSHSWVDVTLGGIGGSLETLAVAADPLGSLTAAGVGWLIEHVKPLTDALDELAGDPVEIAAHAAAWHDTAASTADARERYAGSLRTQAATWTGAAATAYRAHATDQLAALDALATATGAIAAAVEGAGLLVGLVREIVRDLIAQFAATLAARLPQWLAAEGVTLGLATPVVAAQVAALVARWAHRIEHFLRALLASLRRLTGMLDELTAVLNRLHLTLSRLSRSTPFSGRPGVVEHGLLRTGDGIVRSGRRLLMSRDNVLAVAEKYGIDLDGVNFSLDKVRRGSGPGKEFYGVTMPTGEIKLARDAFLDEEQLARTLAHERFHLDELRAGRPFPWNEADRAAYEVRAYAHEERWWQAKKHLLDPEQTNR